MAPKPRAMSKLSELSKDISIKPDPEMRSMPPPPVPASHKILEQEVNALEGCFKNVLVKTGQLIRFSADVKKLGLHNLVSTSPQSLLTSLGRDIETYDQLCDAIECQLLRAISILQRDLSREEKRLEGVGHPSETADDASRAMTLSPTSLRLPLVRTGSDTQSDLPLGPTPTSSPPNRTSILPPRRQSTISLSSLNRPAPPLKLDLSAVSLRLTAEEASLFSSGIRSPVTLAPRSARPMDYPVDLMAALASASSADNAVDIDLTLADRSVPDPRLDQLGNSADKPIELDLESIDINMGDLFGDNLDGNNDVNASLFSPVAPVTDITSDTLSSKGDETFLQALGVTHNNNNNGDIFASMDHNEMAVPSPGTMLANFGASDGLLPDIASQEEGTSFHPENEQFEFGSLDLGFLENQEQEMNLKDMEHLFAGAVEPQDSSTSATDAK